MPKFKLKEATVEVRGESFIVRELTHAERAQWVKEATADVLRGPTLLISLGTVSPKVSEEEANGYPIDVVNVLFNKVMELSGIAAKKENAEKKSEAG